ncbi:PAS domain-containing sensor histidine kinase [Spirosoma linguale]|uniref:histidine kinase n=1 Tax=Spirosoma linguale (strain ATCC 33905 / DSM 74 / LMG 10896 / Claus 1) TaxID=504472 RepID=D2QJ94_SPILD|nr:PAS/PAC sensor signal transduction histidine kinase [Spirosoma linguale DSM 74]
MSIHTRLERWLDTLDQGVAFLKPVFNPDTHTTSFQCQYVNTALASWTSPKQWNEQLQTVFDTGQPWEQILQLPPTNRWFQLRLTRLDDELVFSLQPQLSGIDTPTAGTLQQTDQVLQAVSPTSPTGLALLPPGGQPETIFQPTVEDGLSQEVEQLRAEKRQLEAVIRQQQEEIAQQQQRCQVALESVSDATWEYNLRTGEVLRSARFREILGYTLDEFPDTMEAWEDRLYPGDREALPWHVLDAYRSATRDSHSVAYRIRAKDGTYKHFLDRGRLWQWSADGKPLLIVSTITDMTNQKTMEETLRLDANRQRNLIANLQEGILFEDEQRTIVLVNQHFCDLFAIPATPDQLRGMDCSGMAEQSKHYFKEPAVFVDRVAHLLLEQKPVTGEELELADGRIFERDYVPIFMDGVYAGHLWKYADITSRKRNEALAMYQKEKYQRIIENMNLGLLEVDRDDRIVYTNQSFCDMSGYAYDELVGNIAKDMLLNGQHLDVMSEKNNSRLTGAMDAYELAINNKRGEAKWWLISGAPLYADTGEVIGSTGVVLDITRQKQLESELRESEQRFREIAENVDELFWIRDLHAPKFLYMNPTFERFSGIRVEELYRNPLRFADFVHQDDRAAVLAAFLSDEPGMNATFRVVNPEGTIHWVRAKVVLLTDETGVPRRRLGVASDITAVIENEHILEASLARERELNGLKSQFIATASHQFRTPLMAITSSAELIRYYSALPTGTLKPPLFLKQAEAILKQVSWLEELMTDTLTLSKIEEGKVTLRREELDVVGLCQTLIGDTFSERSDGRQVDLVVVGSPVSVRADRTLLSHVLQNLLSNAFKYAATNPQLTVQYDPGRVMLAVEDKGIGIPANELPLLFGKFFRASNVHSIQGSGLGLAICREYVQLLGGTLEVASTEGVGTTFRILLQTSGGTDSSGG